MRGQVVRSEVRLDFDEPSRQPHSVDLAHQDLAQQVAGDRDGVAVEELGAEQGAGADAFSQRRLAPFRR